MKVYQLQNQKGNPWANQLVINGRFKDGGMFEILQSYDSKVVMVDFGQHRVDFGEDWDYSKTTMRAVNKFLADNLGGEWDSKAIRKAINKGEFIDSYGKRWEVATASNDFFEVLGVAE